jgi:hypothetical protein
MLELASGALTYNNGRCAYANGSIVVAEVQDAFRLRAVGTGGSMIPSGDMCFAKRIVVGWMPGS